MISCFPPWQVPIVPKKPRGSNGNHRSIQGRSGPEPHGNTLETVEGPGIGTGRKTDGKRGGKRLERRGFRSSPMQKVPLLCIPEVPLIYPSPVFLSVIGLTSGGFCRNRPICGKMKAAHLF